MQIDNNNPFLMAKLSNKYIALINWRPYGYYSDDGCIWTKVDLPTTGVWESIHIESDGSCIVKDKYNKGAFLYSKDGTSWTYNRL